LKWISHSLFWEWLFIWAGFDFCVFQLLPAELGCDNSDDRDIYVKIAKIV
jgi:hypothetical protein